MDDDPEHLAVIEAVNSDPDNFASIYSDPGGVLVIQYVGGNAGRAAVESMLSPDLSVRWEKVEYSQSDLMRIAREVGDRELDGVFAISAGTPCNHVTVMVGPGGSVDEISRLLAEAYDDAVRVQYSTDIPVAL